MLLVFGLTMTYFAQVMCIGDEKMKMESAKKKLYLAFKLAHLFLSVALSVVSRPSDPWLHDERCSNCWTNGGYPRVFTNTYSLFHLRLLTFFSNSPELWTVTETIIRRFTIAPLPGMFHHIWKHRHCMFFPANAIAWKPRSVDKSSFGCESTVSNTTLLLVIMSPSHFHMLDYRMASSHMWHCRSCRSEPSMRIILPSHESNIIYNDYFSDREVSIMSYTLIAPLTGDGPLTVVPVTYYNARDTLPLQNVLGNLYTPLTNWKD